jgi:hypothetical protein
VDICDGELARRARAGDAGAFALLVERHLPPARALAARLCAHPDDAQVPADADFMGFELTLAGPGQVRLRHVELTRAS